MAKKEIADNTQIELDFDKTNKNNSEYLELFPGNWLYNASVVGFLLSLEQVEEIDIQPYLQNDGTVKIPKNIFSDLNVEERYFGDNKISSIVGKAPVYRNYLQPSEKTAFPQFVEQLTKVNNNSEKGCCVCNQEYNLVENDKTKLKKNGLSKFIERTENFNMIFNANIAPSINEFPNAFWGIQDSGKVCTLCSFLIIHSDYSNTILLDRSKMFINAPSFKLMFELNKLLKRVFQKSEDNINKRSLLALSVIEYATKTSVLMGNWTAMNLEIVIQKKGILDFYSIPYTTLQLISNRQIASLLSNLGEFKVLNAVLDGHYERITDMGYKLLKLGMKELNKSDWDFINGMLYQNRNKNNLRNTAQKLFKLYALIQEQLKTK